MRMIKCKKCGIQDIKENLIEVGIKTKKHYCKQCYYEIEKEKSNKELLNKTINKNKEDRMKAVNLFYEYTGSLEPIALVNMAFKKAMDKGLTGSDVLYTMEYIKKNNSPLKFPMGFLYYIDRAMKEKELENERFKQNEVIMNSVPKMKIIPIKYKENKEKSESDLSDLF